ncbi:unannotated protein [freshwater metagenome]|uniref:Unannotated protein n=1 Tax=freshwater metagenome TaxID=449393 RepID=A0A6J6F3R0_9ZZZZ
MNRSRIAKYLFSRGKQSLLKINSMAKDERGSISILTIALFLITISLVMITTNIATITLAKRSLTQSAESAAQRGAHFLDESAYYSGKFNVITMAQNLFGQGPEDPGIPIDCQKAEIGIAEALSDLASESTLLIDKGAHNLMIEEIACDGRDLRVTLKVEVDLPFQLPFLNLKSVTLISSATTYNQRNNGLYLFGFRVS